MEDLHFFTMATEPVRGFPQYIASCLRHKIVPHVLGMGQRWEGWTHKARLVREQLDRIPEDDLVVVSDSYDLVFQEGPEEIARAFDLYDKPIVFSAERGNGWPYPNTILPEVPEPLYRSLNSGFWVARVDAAKQMIDETWGGDFGDGSVSEQGAIQQWLSRNHDKATVDYKNVLVTSSSYRFADEDFAYRTNYVYNVHTNTVPCAVHLSGWTDMAKVHGTLMLPDKSHKKFGDPAQRRYRTYLLAMDYPWPTARPDDRNDPGDQLFPAKNARLFEQLLRRRRDVILELGSWVGGSSTKFFLDNSDALIICNDNWVGYAQDTEESKRVLRDPHLYEKFCYNRWYERDRVIPLRMDTIDGIRAVALRKIVPDIIYVDADHRYEKVMAQLILLWELFPDSIITGNDFLYWRSVRAAVLDFSNRKEVDLITDENIWMLKR